jgi:hypothetical protein
MVVRAALLIPPLLLAIALAAFLRFQDAAASRPLPPTSPPPTPTWANLDDLAARVTTEVRALRLVTSEITTTVTSTSSDVSLLGDVSASVTAPVRLLYGVNLESFDAAAVTFSPIHRLYLLRLPPPTRLAAEVLTQFERAEVTTGWMRSRATEGERHLGLARRDLALRAHELAPDADQRQSLRDAAREQVVTLLRRIVGDNAAVRVTFTDEGRGP